MVIKLYISGISGNKEVKKKQQRVQMILDSKQINYEAIDITEPGKEKDKEFMQQNGKVRESLGKYPLPPQIFNDDDFCGDYEDFDMANEVDELEKFLHIETISKDGETDSKQDEDLKNAGGKLSGLKQHSVGPTFNPYEYHTFKIKFNNVNGLQEQIIKTNNLAEESEQNQEVTKSEVNGNLEAIPSVDLSSENITEKVDISTEEVLAPEQEESSALEKKENDENDVAKENDESDVVKENDVAKENDESDVVKENDESDVVKEKEENTEDNEKNYVEREEGEKEEEKEEEENATEDKLENPNEEKSPPLEEKESNDENDDNEGNENEEESEEESPQSEKSQEE